MERDNPFEVSEQKEPTEAQMALVEALAKTALEHEQCVFTAAEILVAASSLVLMQNYAPAVAVDLYGKAVEGARMVLKDAERDAGELLVECAWEGEAKRPVWIVSLARERGEIEDPDAMTIWDTLDQAVTAAAEVSAKLQLPWRLGCVDHAKANVVPIAHGRRQ